MLTVLITGNLSSFHYHMKLYTRKLANFLKKSRCLIDLNKSNDYLIIKMKHILSIFYQFKVFGTHVGNR